MATNYYLGVSKSGAILARSSTRKDFTHAAISGDYEKGYVIRASQSGWSTSAQGAERNFMSYWSPAKRATMKVEIVPVKLVTGAEFRAAMNNPAS